MLAVYLTLTILFALFVIYKMRRFALTDKKLMQENEDNIVKDAAKSKIIADELLGNFNVENLN